MVAVETDNRLPVLRSDIEIYAGPLEEDGSPVYIVHDPVSGVFHKIGWEEAQIIKRLRSGQTLPGLKAEIEKNTTLSVTAEDIAALCQEARLNHLTMDTLIQPPERLSEHVKSVRPTFWKWLAQHYLYFRISLFQPDAFLTRHMDKACGFVSSTAILIYAAMALLGLYFLTQRFESYLATFSYFYTAKGLVVYTLSIVFLKLAHEFGHAFVAKYYGLRVTSMGIAFMVFFPVAYSDVTDAWRLRNRRKRLNIALAGIRVELVIGAFALAFWGLTPPGVMNSLCFILSSTSLLSTLLINLNPAMRYDGYYILSDVLGIDNLFQQATAYTKWLAWRILLGVRWACPIAGVSTKKRAQMVVYALYAWHYRLFLYLGIALIVYHKFTKVLGIFLFVLEITLLIVHPVAGEITMLIKERKQMHMNRRMIVTLLALTALIFWVVLPLPRTSHVPGVYLPGSRQTLYVQKGGRVTKILKKQGDSVRKGDEVVRVESETLTAEIDVLAIEIKQLDYTVQRLSKNSGRMGLIPEIREKLASRKEELAGLVEQRKQLVLKAKIDGRIVWMDDTLQSGIYVGEKQVIGQIATLMDTRINAFFSEKQIKHIRKGDSVIFYPIDYTESLPGIIARINPIREERVDLMEIGTLAARELPLIKNALSGRMTLVDSFYKVTIVPVVMPGSTIRLGTSGRIRYKTAKRSLAWEFLQYCYTVIIRESGF